MGFISSTHIVTEPKTMTRTQLIELRDAIADGRNYGSLSVACASAIAFIPGFQLIGGVFFVIGLGLAYGFAFQTGANDRIQTLLDQGKSSYNVNLKMEFHYETMQEIGRAHV